MITPGQLRALAAGYDAWRSSALYALEHAVMSLQGHKAAQECAIRCEVRAKLARWSAQRLAVDKAHDPL